MYSPAENYEAFIERVKNISRLHIPQSCREQHIWGMTEETSKIKKKYENSFTSGPFSEETIIVGETLTKSLRKDINDRWHELIDNTDMTKIAKKHGDL